MVTVKVTVVERDGGILLVMSMDGVEVTLTVLRTCMHAYACEPLAFFVFPSRNSTIKIKAIRH